MARTDLEKAHSLLRRRKFLYAISLLESGNNPEIYRESFDYFLTAGIACLYLGDTGSATAYFDRARRIRITDATLLNAQAVLFLHRGNTDRAISYYLDALQYDPNNKTSLAALEFVRVHGTFDEICQAIDSGEIKKFYPPLGPNPDTIKRIGFSVFAGLFLAFLIFNFGHFSRLTRKINIMPQERADLSELYLSVEEIGNPQTKDASSFKYKLSDSEIKKAFDMAMTYFQEYKENSSLVEINRLMNSNASPAIKSKASMISSYFTAQSFDTLAQHDDNVEYSRVAKEPDLYLGCWVDWSGRLTNAVTEGKSSRYNLLVGYENMDRVEGFVPLFFEESPYPPLDIERPVRILAQIQVENGKILLNGRSVYQSVKKD